MPRVSVVLHVELKPLHIISLTCVVILISCAKRCQVVAERQEQNDFMLRLAEMKYDLEKKAAAIRKDEIKAERETMIEKERTKQKRIEAVMQLAKVCNFNNRKTRSDILKMIDA